MSEQYTTRDILEMTIKAKEKGVAVYMDLARTSENYHVSQLFSKLAREEQHHKLLLKEWFESLPEAKRSEAYPGEKSMFLRSLVDENTFNCCEAERKILEKSIIEEEALKAAINFEKDYMLFLHELKQYAGTGAEETIDKLLDDETRHIREIFEIRDSS